MTLNPDQFQVRADEEYRGDDVTFTATEPTTTFNGRAIEVPRGVLTYTPPKEGVVPAARGGVGGATRGSAKDRQREFPVVREGGYVGPPSIHDRSPMQTTWLKPHPGGLDDLAVGTEHQGRGISTHLINAAQEVHQERYGRGTFAMPDRDTSLSDDSKGVADHYGVPTPHNDRWSESKASRDNWADSKVNNRIMRSLGNPGRLGPVVPVTSSLQTKLQSAGLAPGPEPRQEQVHQPSMLKGKKSSAPQVKGRYLS